MALITNRRNAVAYTRSTLAGGTEAWDVLRQHNLRNTYAGSGGIDDKSGIPNGHNMGAILLPLKAGGMSVFQDAAEITATSADAKMGRPITASSSCAITVTNAQLDKIASLAGSAALTITATASITSAAALVGSAACAITPSATLGGIIPAAGSSSCTLTPSVTISALAFMEAEAGGPTPLSPEGLADAVWDTLLSDHQDTGTAGKALSDAGGSGNPWSALLADNNDTGTFGERVQKLLTTAKFLGLK